MLEQIKIDKAIEFLWMARDLLAADIDEEKKTLVIGYTQRAHELIFSVTSELCDEHEKDL